MGCEHDEDNTYAQEIVTSAQKEQDWLVSLRREIHLHPELAFQEKTSAFIHKELDLTYLIHTQSAETVIVAQIGSGSPPIIAIRADIDALLLQFPCYYKFCIHAFGTSSVIVKIGWSCFSAR